MVKLDTDFVRSQFPAFYEPELQGKGFFENAGGSYTCKSVIERLFRFYHQRKVQPYSPYTAATLGGEEMDEARIRLSAIMNIAVDELSFGPSTSQNTYVLSQAFRQMLRPGDSIIVTNQDHEANSGVWRRLIDSGIDVREWQVDADTGHLDPADLINMLDGKVKLVCFPHCSNIVGEINPVLDICTIAREAGAYSCVDGVSYAPHGLPDIGNLGADIYLFSTYKTYGPHQGIMYVRRSLADVLPNQAHYFNEGSRVMRFTPAGPDHAQVAACAGLADYVDLIHNFHFDANSDPVARGRAVYQLQAEKEKTLLEPLLDYLRERKDVRLIGPNTPIGRVPTVAIQSSKDGIKLAAELANYNIMAGGGNFYAVRLLEALGIDPEKGVLRLSFVHYTAEHEIEQLISGLDQVL